MNHKRGKPKNARAGCLMCKYYKQNGMKHLMRHSHKRMSERKTACSPTSWREPLS